jgi:hypothetical protein
VDDRERRESGRRGGRRGEGEVPTAQLEKNVIKVATKKHKDKLYFKREGIDEANVIQGKRNR